LIPEVDVGERDRESITELELSAIEPNPDQPRKEFDQERLEELAASIKEHGIVQPIVVRPKGKGYEIVAGERRWRAARLAGLEKVPALVREFSEAERMEIALVENLQREDLNPLEEAEAYRALMETLQRRDWRSGWVEAGPRWPTR
jgi:ParB family chromosome partitioning protein